MGTLATADGQRFEKRTEAFELLDAGNQLDRLLGVLAR